MEAITKPITEMSAAEIETFLKQKKAAENQQQQNRKKAYETDKENFLKEVLSRFTDARGILETLKNETITHSENFNALKYQLEDKAVKEANFVFVQNLGKLYFYYLIEKGNG